MPFSQQDLAKRFLQAEEANAYIAAAVKRGGLAAGAAAMNELFDSDAIVEAMWRAEDGQYGSMIVKGRHHLERIRNTGVGELMGVRCIDAQSHQKAMMIRATLTVNPGARWVAGADGGFGLR